MFFNKLPRSGFAGHQIDAFVPAQQRPTAYLVNWELPLPGRGEAKLAQPLAQQFRNPRQLSLPGHLRGLAMGRQAE